MSKKNKASTNTAFLQNALSITCFPYTPSIHKLLAGNKSVKEMKPVILYGFHSKAWHIFMKRVPYLPRSIEFYRIRNAHINLLT